jgi:hypothetical protein
MYSHMPRLLIKTITPTRTYLKKPTVGNGIKDMRLHQNDDNIIYKKNSTQLQCYNGCCHISHYLIYKSPSFLIDTNQLTLEALIKLGDVSFC